MLYILLKRMYTLTMDSPWIEDMAIVGQPPWTTAALHQGLDLKTTLAENKEDCALNTLHIIIYTNIYIYPIYMYILYIYTHYYHIYIPFYFLNLFIIMFLFRTSWCGWLLSCETQCKTGLDIRRNCVWWLRMLWTKSSPSCALMLGNQEIFLVETWEILGL